MQALTPESLKQLLSFGSDVLAKRAYEFVEAGKLDEAIYMFDVAKEAAQGEKSQSRLPPSRAQKIKFLDEMIRRTYQTKLEKLGVNVNESSVGTPGDGVPKPIAPSKLIAMSDIYGAEREKYEVMRDFILPLKFPSMLTRGSGLLMYGPPGTGKTLMAKAIATEYNQNLLSDNELANGRQVAFLFAASGAELKGKGVGETEKNIKKWFEAAQTLAEETVNEKGEPDPRALSILFLDEVEAIAMNRSVSGPIGMASVNALLQAMDGVTGFDKVLVVAATNIPWAIDPAIMSRFSAQLFTDLPTDRARSQLIEQMVRKRANIASNSSPEALSSIVVDLTHLTGASSAVRSDTRDIQMKFLDDFMKQTGRGLRRGNTLLGYSMRDIDRGMTRALNAVGVEKLTSMQRVGRSQRNWCYHIVPENCVREDKALAWNKDTQKWESLPCKKCDTSVAERKLLSLTILDVLQSFEAVKAELVEATPSLTWNEYRKYVGYYVRNMALRKRAAETQGGFPCKVDGKRGDAWRGKWCEISKKDAQSTSNPKDYCTDWDDNEYDFLSFSSAKCVGYYWDWLVDQKDSETLSSRIANILDPLG